jgi:hypothetical protein
VRYERKFELPMRESDYVATTISKARERGAQSSCWRYCSALRIAQLGL